jgi:hypothetical protein
MITLVNIVAFIADPLMVILGFLMFGYPQAWAKMNARTSRKELHQFDSSKQLAHTKQLGILFMAFAAFSFLSMLALKTALARLN